MRLAALRSLLVALVLMVALSVPAIYFFSFFRNRAAVYTAETLLAADEMVRRIIQQSKTKATPPLPVAARA